MSDLIHILYTYITFNFSQLLFNNVSPLIPTVYNYLFHLVLFLLCRLLTISIPSSIIFSFLHFHIPQQISVSLMDEFSVFTFDMSKSPFMLLSFNILLVFLRPCGNYAPARYLHFWIVLLFETPGFLPPL